ncbi:MAG TPA: (2Fe-2S)-binding protein [Acidimicrobiia bacterium]|nr:(2Fe-2S)-binding protein [Acidimicrobiia bacterium]
MTSYSKVRFKANGRPVEVDANPDSPLLYALRNDLDLPGTMYGCGIGYCGACFVLIDGRAATSCDTPLWSVENKDVVTIEGLEGPDGLNPVQRAFIEEQAAQCGYCVAGIIVNATALLDENSQPTEAEVREHLDRNMCRCGSHPRMIAAVLKAAGEL